MRGPSEARRSLCKYANGEMKSKYQSARGIVSRVGQFDEFRVCRAPYRQCREHCALVVGVKQAPRGDLVERAQASDAKPARVVHSAYGNAGRRDVIGVVVGTAIRNAHRVMRTRCAALIG